MGITTVPRNIARLEYTAIRLPLTLLEEHVVARYWDDEAVLRMGFERFLGSLDGLAGRLLADHDLSRRGQALIMRTEATAELDAQAAAAYQQEQEEKRQLRRTADARATAKQARARQAAEKRATRTEATRQAEQQRTSARRARSTAAPKRQLSDAAVSQGVRRGHRGHQPGT